MHDLCSVILAAVGLDDPPAPSLLEWVWPSTRDKFHAAISHGVNLLFAPPSVDVGRLQRKFDPILFQLPFRMKNPCALVAHNVELVFAEKDKNEGKSPSHASGEDVNVAEDDVLVKLQLSGFMVKKMSPSKPRMIKDLEERAKAPCRLMAGILEWKLASPSEALVAHVGVKS
eukprot:s324_g2.t1